MYAENTLSPRKNHQKGVEELIPSKSYSYQQKQDIFLLHREVVRNLVE
jgi:hypothetical protein